MQTHINFIITKNIKNELLSWMWFYIKLHKTLKKKKQCKDFWQKSQTN